MKKGKEEEEKGSPDGGEKVVVAVKAAKEIPKAALMWALAHVVQPSDYITLLVVVPPQSSGRKFLRFPRFSGDCANNSNNNRKSHSGASSEQKCEIADSCSQMILQLHNVYDQNKINVKIKILLGSLNGAVAAEVKKAQATWVVLDKHLKNEEKCCMEELQCNIVVMKRSQPKVLRLNLVGSPPKKTEVSSIPSHALDESSKIVNENLKNSLNSICALKGTTTPSSSPELSIPFTATEAGTSSVSSSNPGTSPILISNINRDIMKKEEASIVVLIKENHENRSNSDLENEILSTTSLNSRYQPRVKEVLPSHAQFPKLDNRTDIDFSGRNVREVVSLSGNMPLGPPPLCSFCQHKAPVFGNPPRWFSYAELELATNGFSQENFLAEGGFGSVYRGVLSDGQMVAVKQHKLASSQGDHEFCSEVEVLSCAQHRNVVLLIGFCIEDKRRLLVYEYICNGSLDSHLYGRKWDPLEWSARQKIAVGAARGLRYLHEECRVGCIVHRDMRPNNIIVNHDFEPLVGDFGLARWQPDGDMAVETRVIGTFGYLAPEYAQSGQITEKADVYSFGVVLVELITGRKAVDLKRPKGQQCLAEWARPLLEEFSVDKLLDARLGNSYSEHEVYCMVHAASLCIQRNPNARPRMSQVLRILEGNLLMDGKYMSKTGNDVGNRSGRIWTEQKHQQRYAYLLLDDT